MSAAASRRRRVLALALPLVAACAPSAEAPADSAAAPALPPELAAILDVGAVLDDAYLRTRPAGECRTAVDATSGQLRRTVGTRLPDGTTRLVFVRAAPTDSSPQRVEVVHRPAGGEQAGITWSERGDDVRVVRYGAPGAPGAGGARYDQAAVAAAMREVGRRAMRLACDAGR